MTAAVDDTDTLAPTDYLDNLMLLIAHVRAEKPRDPLRRLEDICLELRWKVTRSEGQHPR